MSITNSNFRFNPVAAFDAKNAEIESLRQQLADNDLFELDRNKWRNNYRAEIAKLTEQVTLLRDALTKERDLRVFGQSEECGKTHWESIRDMRRDVYQKTDEALAATDPKP